MVRRRRKVRSPGEAGDGRSLHRCSGRSGPEGVDDPSAACRHSEKGASGGGSGIALLHALRSGSCNGPPVYLLWEPVQGQRGCEARTMTIPNVLAPFTEALPATLLYHYTTGDGLKSILTEQELWATDVNYMNDSSELKYGTDMFASALRHKCRSCSPETQKLLETALDRMNFLSNEFYAACFCEARDALNQWRVYGGRGGGYALGLDPSLLAHAVVRNSLPLTLLGQVLYDGQAQEQRIQTILNALCSHYETEVQTNPTETLFGSAVVALQVSITLFRVLVKDPVFSEEKEWRIVVWAGTPPDRICDFRIANGIFVPFLRFNLCPNPSVTAIKEIIVGPTLHVESAVQSLRRFVDRATPWNGIRIEPSAVPLRF
jgi:hypothetical protein